MNQTSCSNKVREKIASFDKGRIFFPEELSTLGSSVAVRLALMRLCEEGVILRLAQGIYCYPAIDDKWGTGVLYPSVDDIAYAIAARDKCRISPTGTYAMNALGLSTQLQANTVYYTDGSPRRIKIGNGHGILFRRSSEMKRFSFKSHLMQLVVSALREIGNGKVAGKDKNIIANKLKEVPSSDFDHDIQLAPEWVQNLLIELR